MMIFNPDSLRTQVEAATGGRVTVLYDDKGYPSYMHVIPKFRYEDLGLDGVLGAGVATAFLKDGQEKSEIFIGQFQASMYDGRAVALPGKDPRTSINFDAAKAACVDKGPGWHLMNAHEWAAVALWCKANGFEPRGNTNWGRAHDATHETAVRPDGGTPGVSSGTGRTATGGGPASWRHDGGLSGIADLVGNVWEWQDLLKTKDGRIITTLDNAFDKAESDWISQDHYVSNEGGSPRLQNSAGNAVDASISQDWNTLSKQSGYTESELMKRLLISPDTETEMQGRFYINTNGERFPRRGGDWNNGSAAGLAALALSYARSRTHTNTGFRPAFVS
ncbi:hypothetical protein [Vibrio injensis]|uniref:hypothetical protein n=1 Tax=Vibrio injensis TaxID=1307414 RepID=UPI000932D483|nr:hypothetical protein [Vibrio injensis]